MNNISFTLTEMDANATKLSFTMDSMVAFVKVDDSYEVSAVYHRQGDEWIEDEPVVEEPTLSYDPYTVEPAVGMWATFCCLHDCEQMTTQEAVEQFLECPTDKNGARLYQGEPCKAFFTLEDCAVYEQMEDDLAEYKAFLNKETK